MKISLLAFFLLANFDIANASEIKPFGAVYTTHTSALEVGFNRFISSDYKWQPRENQIFFTCKDESCQQLNFVTKLSDKEVIVHSTLDMKDIDSFMDSYSQKINDEAEREEKKDVYSNTKSVLGSPDAFFLTIPAAGISAVIETVKSPLFLATKKMRANGIKKSGREIILKLLDQTAVGEINNIEYNDYFAVVKSISESKK